MGSRSLFKVGISGSYGGLNLGDEAILESIITQLRETLPVEITVFSRNPEDTLKRHKVDRSIPTRNLSLKEIKPEIENLDLFILGGGGILYDADAKLYLREVVIARENNIPVMLYAIGAGPLEDRNTQRLVKEVLNEVNLITVREHAAQRLLESIGVTNEITVTADPALLLGPQPLPEGTIARESLEKKRMLVGFSVREPGVAAPDLNTKRYHSILANAADFIVDRMNADIVFIPMENRGKDLQHSHAVISQMLKPEHAWVLKGEYTSGQMMSIMSHMDFAIGMRLHFLIFSFLLKLPFVALPYASKVSGFLNILGMEMPPIHLVNAGRLIAHIDNSWDIKNEIRNKIEAKLPGMQERSRQTNSLLHELLKDLYPDRYREAIPEYASIKAPL